MSLLPFDFLGPRGASFDPRTIALGGGGKNHIFHYGTPSTKQDKGLHLLDIIIGQCAPILELFSRENQALLVGWNAFFILNL